MMSVGCSPIYTKGSSNQKAQKTSKKSSSKADKQSHSIIETDVSRNSFGPSLPANFAEEVLRLEMEIEIESRSVKIEVIHHLLELYTTGVGYFESIGDMKYQYFGKKINSLMMKPQVIESLNSKCNPTAKETRETPRTPRAANVSTEKESSQVIGTKSAEREVTPKSEISSQVPLVQNSEKDPKQKDEQSFSSVVLSEQKEKEQEKEKPVAIPLIKRKAVEEGIKLNLVYGMHDNQDKSRYLLQSHASEQQKNSQTVAKEINGQMEDIRSRIVMRRTSNIKDVAPKRKVEEPVQQQLQDSISENNGTQSATESTKEISEESLVAEKVEQFAEQEQQISDKSEQIVEQEQQIDEKQEDSIEKVEQQQVENKEQS